MKRSKKKRSILWRLVEAVFIVVFLVVLALLIQRLSLAVRRYDEQREATYMLRYLLESVGVAPTPEPSPTPTPRPEVTLIPLVHATPTPTPEPTPTPKPTPEPTMLAEVKPLLEQNKDYVGMLGFAEQALYVCQGEDNRYYASHRFDGSEDAAGMIYMDARCGVAPPSMNRILYGHNMKDGSRFGTLRRFASKAFIKENPTVTFAGLYGIETFTPFAVLYVSVDESHTDYFEFDIPDFAAERDFNVFLAGLRARSMVDLSDVEVRYGDRLLTLATCSEEYDGGRLVVVCVQK